MQRRLELDALRGTMLVWITLTHLPTGLSPYINQPFGYLSATEGFIFLSALFTGMIYRRLAQREGCRAMCRKLWLRTGRIYLYQALLMAFAFAVEARIAAHGGRPAVHNLLDFYFAVGPVRAISDAALLLYRPPLLDILPMYIFFLALSPVVLMAARRFGWKYLLSGASALWLLAQFGQREAVYHLLHRFLGLQIPLHEMGAFDLWAWQFWWVAGLWLGDRWAEGKDSPFTALARRGTALAAVFAAGFLALRSMEVFGVLSWGGWTFLVDKWHLGVLRMVDFVAIATLAVRFQTVLKGIAVRPLVLLGQASLQVFCVHLVFIFLALTLMGEAPVMPGWEVPVAIAVSLSALLITARLFARTGQRPARPERRGPEYARLAPVSTGKAL